MKTPRFFLLLSLFCMAASLCAQVSTIPSLLQKGYNGEISIIFNPQEGNKGMVGAKACYAHIGITYNGKSWQNAPAWRSGLSKHKLTQSTDGNWTLLITPDIYTYFGVSDTTDITQLCMVFNDGPSGSKEGKTADGGDIFIDLAEAGYAVRFDSDLAPISSLGQTITLSAEATSAGRLTLVINSDTVKRTLGTRLSHSYTLPQAGDYTFECIAQSESGEARDTISTCVPKSPTLQSRPAGILNGIYYYPTDSTRATLCTYAGSKTAPAKHVFVVGDFNDWTISDDYQLFQDPDSAYFWIHLDHLTPQEEYAYQYVVVRADGKVKRISDLYATKLLCADDQYEPLAVDSTLKPYPSQAEGYCAVLQTAQPSFDWSDATLSFQRPNKNNLLIYELWIYDYTPLRSIPALMERLDYLQTLGVNAIELMPVTEFDGNYNWGYSPNHYFALDKAYGTPHMLKTFIDECHQRGMAVILDMVFNHATGLNPMNKLYPYGEDLAQNPWFNANPPHGDNFYEDWNHDFAPAQAMFSRALQYWLREYKVDGFRMDLSHGLCGETNNALTHIQRYYDAVKALSPDAYFILEHWGANMATDRPKLVQAGMLCWQNTNNAYCQTAMGWLKDGDSFTDANKDGYVSYCESHDEERMQYKCTQWGNGAIKTSQDVRLSRVAANVVMNILLNGPHMLWQFEEIGYDFSINSSLDTPNGTSEDDRCSKKPRPEHLGYFQDPVRMQQFALIAQAAQLRTRILPHVFEGDPTASSVTATKSVRSVQWGDSVFVVANLHASTSQSLDLPAGTWYDYYAKASTPTTTTLTLLPGEVRIFTHRPIPLPEIPQDYQFSTSLSPEQIFTNPSTDKTIYKRYVDGQIVIQKGANLYNLLGNRIK